MVETNIHYPTDSTLMGDGVRVLTRVMKTVAAVAGEAGNQFRDRSRSVKRRVLEIAYASRDKSEKGQQKMKVAYSKLLDATSRVVRQAKKFSGEIAGKVKKGRWADSDLLTLCIEKHRELLGRVPDLAVADAGFFSAVSPRTKRPQFSRFCSCRR